MCADGFKWVWLCAMALIHKETEQKEVQMGQQGMISEHAWPGNFPKKDMYKRTDRKGQGGTQEGVDEFGWVQGDALTRGKRKTRGKERFMVAQGIFGTIICVGEMATRIMWSTHDHHRECRDVVEAQGVSRQPTLHVQTTHKKNAHETTRKRRKQTTLFC